MGLFIVSIVLVIVLLIGFSIFSYQNQRRRGKKVWFTLFLAFLSAFPLLFGVLVKVDANNVGVIYDDRYGIVDETKHEGFQIKSIFEHVKQISTANRSNKLTTTGQTNDGQYATFELSIIYKVKAEDAVAFYKATNSTEISDAALATIVKTSLQTSTIEYNIFEVMSTGLDEAKATFTETLSETLYSCYGITLIETSFDDIDAGEDIESILQQKAEAEQKIEIARKEAEAALVTATNDVLIAEQQALTKQTLADAEAYAIKVQGQGEAEAATAYINEINDMIAVIEDANSMTYADAATVVLQIVFYEKWDGVLPSVLTSDSLSALIGSLISGDSE
ncbi:MAG: hypothetical protein H6687_02590 [Bacillales bacterium]|nr:hypothetical protein [Bacillales bacterium]